MALRVYLLVFALLAFSAPVSETQAQPSDALSQLVGERLGHMKAVAAFKWINGIAIEDKAREEVVIESARVSAREQGVNPDTAEPFFQTQIEAAKDIQRYWFETWRTGDAPTSAPDLVKEIRPELLRLGRDINRALAVRSSYPEKQDFLNALDIEGLGHSRVESLHANLQGVEILSRATDSE